MEVEGEKEGEIDDESGEEGEKVAIGYGETFMGALRFGLSYADFKNKDYIGIESLLTAMDFNLKFGVYKEVGQSDVKVMVGIGYNFGPK